MVRPQGRTQERVRAFFSAHGIAEDRVELVAHGLWSEYVRLFQRIDLALDPFPCNGMTTTCHALWMGLLVVTLAGATAVSRTGLSILHTVGLSELVAYSEPDYIRVAAEWGNDLPRLERLRPTLRARMQASPLMDAPRFAGNIEETYRAVWKQWSARSANH